MEVVLMNDKRTITKSIKLSSHLEAMIKASAKEKTNG
jgi:hypothetical protein